MGNGVVAGNKLKMLVVARTQLTPAEWAQWQRAISKFSDLLWDCTQGQLQVGDIYFADDDNGADIADILLYASGDPSFASGSFGQPGSAFHVMPYVKEQVLTFVHELGHYLWDLDEEYTAPYGYETIDTSNPAPNKKTIPIVSSGLANDELVTAQANILLRIASKYERRTVTANTATTITVDSDFSVLPTSADNTNVVVEFPAECATSNTANFCIMENSRGAAGLLAPDGTWTPAANPVTEFCTNSNHDGDGDTQQEDLHGKSCWETIVTIPGFEGFTLPNPAAPGPATAPDPVNFYVLDPDPRFAIVLDRSGSMADGNKLPDAKHAAHYWVEFCAASGDQLTVVWYDHDQDVLLNLTEVDSLTANQRQQLENDIDALTPRGATGIRDALLSALTEISSPPTRAATQVAVLLTDGIHNTPWLSRAQDAIPALRENGLRVYAVGVGEPNEVDMPTLDDIAAGTGGRSYAVGTNQPNLIETALVEINAEVRGGIIASVPEVLPDAKASEADRSLRKKRPPFRTLAKAFGISIDADGQVHIERDDRAVAVRMFVEKNAERASFALLHPEADEAWLYLVDPAGNVVEVGDPGHTHVRSHAPHEFSIVAGPTPGWWTLLLVRPQPGPSFPVRAVGGVEHKGLEVFAKAPASGEDGQAIEVVAGARHGLPLTAVKVRARLTSPSGAAVVFPLDDADEDGQGTGVYRGSFQADEVGWYRGYVAIRCDGHAEEASPLTRLRHLEDGGPLDVTSDAPAFRRIVPVSVLVRKRGSGFEPDRRDERYVERWVSRWQRPTRLKSAKLPRRRRAAAS